MRSSLRTSFLVALVPMGGLRATPAIAQRPACITLGDAFAAASRQNPDLRIAAAIVDSAQAERHIAAAFPNPVVAGTPNTPYQYSVSIPLDLTPQRRARTRVAEFGFAAAAADRRDATRQITLAVARAFFDALLAQERQALVARRRDLFAQILQTDSARYRVGDIPLRNLERSEVELARAELEVARTKPDVQVAMLALQGLMGVERADTAARAEGHLDFRRLSPTADTALIDMAMAARPDHQAALRRIEQSRSAEGMARALLIPTPELGLVRQFSAPFESGHYYSLGLSVELPSLNRYGGQRERARAAVDAATVAASRATAQVERDVRNSLSMYHTQRDLVDRYQGGIVDRVARSVDAARYAYAKGSASLLEVLDAVRAEQDVRTELVNALHDYWVSAYALNAAVGRDVLGIGP